MSQLFDLTGRIACVTGAGGGLGQAAASLLARSGAKVVGIARRREALAAWQSRTGGETAIVAADLSDRAALAQIAADAARAFGDPDILINAAGINTRQPAD
ncbi:MAG TPA: SDR family NAD(P)-dependent oxidoreductase, partial [Paracoccus sp.]|nr:SDR family NAD(P)-dependent oxidoreductase [Paracoccus sp. (in: a-proteobacteria)]